MKIRNRILRLTIPVFLALFCLLVCFFGTAFAQVDPFAPPPVYTPPPTPKFSLPDDMEFVTIPSGSFQMGSPSSEDGRLDDEKQHKVYVNSFELMTTEVTQGIWEEMMDDDPSAFNNDDNYPIENVSYNDYQDFIDELNDLEPNNTYRLPSEAEWEYACRAGSTTVITGVTLIPNRLFYMHICEIIGIGG